MKKVNLFKLSLLISTFVVLTACGGGSGGTTPPTDPTGDNSSNIVPKTVNITIPDGLKTSRTTTSSKTSFQKTSDTIPSRGYEQLKSTIKEVESTIRNVKENMVLLGNMMPDIQTACEGTAINTQCTIPAGEITLTIDNNITSDLNAIQSEFSDVEEEGGLPPLNTELTMGQILYTVFDSNHTYQQDVVIDLKPTFSALGLTVNKQLETVRWSDDNNSVETISDVNDTYGTFYMNLSYSKKSDGSSFMSISNEFTNPAIDSFPSISGNFSVTLEDLADTNNTVKITSNGEFSDGTFNDSFSSTGQISDNGGYLNSNGTFGENKYAEKETFDAKGNLLQSKFCDDIAEDTCNINDESTWHTFDDDLGIDDAGFSEEEFDIPEITSASLAVTGGNLKSGLCNIMPTDYNLSNLDGTNLYENSIGFIVKTEESEEARGHLEDLNYQNELANVPVVCYYYENPNDMYRKQTVLIGDDRPTLTIRNESVAAPGGITVE